MRITLALIIAAAFSTISCSSGGGGGGGGAPTYSCVTNDYSGGITVSGNAVYRYRQNGNGIANIGPHPAIRNAEVRVYDANNALITCSATDDTGNFSITLPQTNASMTLRVNSIIYNSLTKAFVYNNPSNNTAHYIFTTFTADTTKSVGTLTAEATGDVKGGAFNILDKIHGANIYMAAETLNCASLFSTCTPFTGAPAVTVYWDKGVNPGSYFAGAGALSFYLPGERELYILGGVSGDVDNSDCDHFDNSVILHEYGHFIEDVFSQTDSPGGSHNGDTILDARLAWGEGWGNFFQAAALDSPVYRDTSGNISGSTTVFFNENLETPANDVPSTMGEGNFREFSITRMLWDVIDSNSEGASVDVVDSSFAEIWAAFTNTTTGLASGIHHFRNVGLFHTIQQAMPGATDWSSIRTGEKQKGNQEDYARTVTRGGSCSPIAIQAANIDPGQPENGSTANSNHFASNDFYSYYHGGGSFNFSLNYTTDSSTPADLDVYIFPEEYSFASNNSVKSATTNISPGTGSATENITGSLPAGYYMINIRVDTGIRLGNNTAYSMTLGGQALCPN